MSQVISSESFRKIEPLISDNYSNIYARMRMKLNEEELALFTRPDFPQPNAGQWICDLNQRLHPFNEANDREKEEIAAYLEKMKRQILPKLTGNANFKNVFEIPTTDQIFWWRDDQGRMRCMLAQWGFHLFNAPDNVNVIDVLISLPRRFLQTEVKVHIRYSDGLPASKATFKRYMFNAESDFTTDENGDSNFGEMLPGQQFSVYDGTGRRYDFEVLSDVNDYNAEFDYITKYTIIVVNQFDEPIPGFTINVDGQPMTSNNEGKVEVEGVVLTPNKVIKVSADGVPAAEFKLTRNAQTNVFTYKIAVEEKTDFDIKVVNQDGMPKPDYTLIVNGQRMVTDFDGMVKAENWVYQRGDQLNVVTAEGMNYTFNLNKDPEQNHFIVELRDPIYTGYAIQVVNQRGEAKADYPVSVDTYQYRTNEYGVLMVDNVLWEEGAVINVCAEGGMPQNFMLSRDPGANNFIYPIQENFPQEQKVRIQVLDYDKTPLGNLMVSIKARDGQRLSGMTDNDGFIEFPAIAFEEGKKTKVEFTVTKEYRKALEERKKQMRKGNRNSNNSNPNNSNPNNPNNYNPNNYNPNNYNPNNYNPNNYNPNNYNPNNYNPNNNSNGFPPTQVNPNFNPNYRDSENTTL